jgi:hypothetical protein
VPILHLRRLTTAIVPVVAGFNPAKETSMVDLEAKLGLGDLGHIVVFKQ